MEVEPRARLNVISPGGAGFAFPDVGALDQSSSKAWARFNPIDTALTDDARPSSRLRGGRSPQFVRVLAASDASDSAPASSHPRTLPSFSKAINVPRAIAASRPPRPRSAILEV